MHIKKGSIYLVLDSTPISDENILGRSDSRTKSLGRGVSFLIAPVVPLKSYWKNWEDRATAFVFQIVRKSICKPQRSASNVCDYIACLELKGSIHDTIHERYSLPFSVLVTVRGIERFGFKYLHHGASFHHYLFSAVCTGPISACGLK